MSGYGLLVWSGLRANPMRTGLTFATLVVAFYLVGLLKGFELGFDAAVERIPNTRLSVAPRSMAQTVAGLPTAYLRMLQEMDGVKAAAYVDVLAAYFQSRNQWTRFLAIDADGYFSVYDEYIVPPRTRAAFDELRTGAIIGQAVADTYGWQAGDRITLVADGTPQTDGSTTWTVDVVGFWDTPADSHVESRLSFIHYDYLDHARRGRKGLAGGFSVQLNDAANPALVSRRIDEAFMNSAAPTRTLSIREIVAAPVQRIGDFRFFVNAIVGSALLTILFVTCGAMSQSIATRIPEFAVLQAVGYRDSTITWLVLGESLTICLAAAAVGLVLAVLTAPGAIARLDIPPTDIPVATFIYGFTLAIALGCIAVVVPATRIRRISVIDALSGR